MRKEATVKGKSINRFILFSIFFIFSSLLLPLKAQIFYGEEDAVVMISKDGTDTTIIAEERPDGLAVDPNAGYVYWSETVYHDVVKRAKYDGSGEEILYGGTFAMVAPKGMSLDLNTKKLYFVDLMNTGKILRCNLDGTNLETLVAGAENGVTDGILDIDLDLVNNKMYWVIRGGVMRADLDGSNIEVVVDIADYKQPSGIAINTRDGYVYWIDSGNNAIMRAGLDGSNPGTFISDGQPEGISLDMDAGKIYWVNSGSDDNISRADLDGSNIEKVRNINWTSGAIEVEGFSLTSVVNNVEKNIIPSKLTLKDNYPNPFNPETVIQYSLPEEVNVTLNIYNSLGQLVESLVNDRIQSAGRHQVKFNGTSLTSGIYFYRLETGAKAITKKMMLMK